MQRSRAEWGSITRERLVTAALAEIEAGRYDQLSIRSLAARLGVAPMSLYRHVASRDDLLEAVTDKLVDDCWEPRCDPASARAWIAEAACRLHKLLVSQPAALQAFLSHPVTTPANLERLHAMLAVLQRSGLTEYEARRAFAGIQVYVLGFSAVEANRSRWLADNAGQVAADPEAEWLATLTSGGSFADGLAALLDGLGIK